MTSRIQRSKSSFFLFPLLLLLLLLFLLLEFVLTLLSPPDLFLFDEDKLNFDTFDLILLKFGLLYVLFPDVLDLFSGMDDFDFQV